MAISIVKAVFHSDLKTVWSIVTSYENYQWRSNLSRIEVVDENQFIEYTKDGYATTFTITASTPFERWEFDMENSNMTGHWIGVFKGKGSLMGCYVTGTAWFMVVYAQNAGSIGLGAALLLCVVLFVIPDMVKSGLALWLSQRLEKVIVLSKVRV